MSYERKDIPALIEAFTAARNHIAAGHPNTYFLCHALETMASPAQQKAESLVKQALDCHYTLTTWLTRTIDTDFDDTTTNMRQLRIRWCDKIIADLKAYQK